MDQGKKQGRLAQEEKKKNHLLVYLFLMLSNMAKSIKLDRPGFKS
jgi:hypothetical protein